MLYRAAILLSFLMLILTNCSSPILKSEQAVQWNQELREKVFRAKSDIFPEFANQSDKDRPLFTRGTLVKIQIESSADWVKVRARDAKKDRENTPGHVILYVFSDDLNTDEGNGRQLIQERLDQILSPAN
ncbi:MAG: type II secretion system-associated lipoprotein [Leptospiraceae bacterium]|nr:type II secretion system-associated lipoprotein [Leptospiraceae bacterium]